MNHEILWDVILVVFGGCILFIWVATFLRAPQLKFKIPYPFVVGALWGSIAVHTIETDNRIRMYIFIGLLGLMLLFSVNVRIWGKEANNSSTGA